MTYHFEEQVRCDKVFENSLELVAALNPDDGGGVHKFVGCSQGADGANGDIEGSWIWAERTTGDELYTDDILLRFGTRFL